MALQKACIYTQQIRAVDSILTQHLRRWSNINPALAQRLVFAGYGSLGPIKAMCAQRLPKTPFISFLFQRQTSHVHDGLEVSGTKQVEEVAAKPQCASESLRCEESRISDEAQTGMLSYHTLPVSL